MFMDFLRSMSLFGQSAPVERIQELVEIIEGQADLDAQFDVSASFLILYVSLVVFHFNNLVTTATVVEVDIMTSLYD